MLKGIKSLTRTAQVTFFIVSALHIVDILKGNYSLSLEWLREQGKPVEKDDAEWNKKGEDLYIWCLETFKQIVRWIGEKDLFGDYFYDNYLNDEVYYLGYYSSKVQFQESCSLDCCSISFHIACHVMMSYDEVGMPSDIVEVRDESFLQCIEFAQKASVDSEAEMQWQEAILERLLKDYHTEDSKDFGPDISWEYIESLFGAKLPFEKPIPLVEQEPILPHFLVDYSDDIKQNIAHLTVRAQVTLVVLSALRIVDVLKDKRSIFLDKYKEMGLPFIIDGTEEEWHQLADEIYQWSMKNLDRSLKWIKGKVLSGEYFYGNYINGKNVFRFLGYYEFQPREEGGLNACMDAIYIACHAMLRYDKAPVPYAVAQYTLDNLCECLEFAQKASADPDAEKQWQERVIKRLLENFYTEDPTNFGPNISQHYMEELLGQKLPL